jgi:YegS/Rv2252/BmrU family lipid kinase
MKLKLIINPKSGKKRGRIPPVHKLTFKRLKEIYVPKETPLQIVDKLRKRCQQEKISFDFDLTKYSGHATKLAAEAAKQKYDIVVAAGGDGTINEVINGLAKTDTKLGIIPLGTVNVLGIELDIPLNTEKAIDIIIDGNTQKIDLGLSRSRKKQRYFALWAGIGFDASVISDVDSRTKKVFGAFAYPFSAIKKLFTYRWHSIYATHNHIDKGYYVVVSNIRYYGGEFKIADKASLTDGYLDLCIFKKKNWWNMLRYMLSLSIGTATKYLDIEYHKVKKVKITSKKNMLVHVDGEILGKTPLEIKIIPEALEMIVPK